MAVTKIDNYPSGSNHNPSVANHGSNIVYTYSNGNSSIYLSYLTTNCESTENCTIASGSFCKRKIVDSGA